MSFDPQVSAAYWNQRNRRDAELLQARISQAWDEVRRLARDLREKAGVNRLVLFGSLAEGTVRSEQFDIDLAYEGGDDTLCLSVAETSSFSVDLVDYTLLPPHVQERVDRLGKVL